MTHELNRLNLAKFIAKELSIVVAECNILKSFTADLPNDVNTLKELNDANEKMQDYCQQFGHIQGKLDALKLLADHFDIEPTED